MSTIPPYHGGPAFPHTNEGTYETLPDGTQKFVCTDGGNGMTLRDWFAGQALAGFPLSDYENLCNAARSAYETADAMLKVRKE
jgi:hypothetical protein